jgi:hypothetical protein
MILVLAATWRDELYVGFDDVNLTVCFTARVDGEPIGCAMTVEALEIISAPIPRWNPP